MSPGMGMLASLSQALFRRRAIMNQSADVEYVPCVNVGNDAFRQLTYRFVVRVCSDAAPLRRMDASVSVAVDSAVHSRRDSNHWDSDSDDD